MSSNAGRSGIVPPAARPVKSTAGKAPPTRPPPPPTGVARGTAAPPLPLSAVLRPFSSPVIQQTISNSGNAPHGESSVQPPTTAGMDNAVQGARGRTLVPPPPSFRAAPILQHAASEPPTGRISNSGRGSESVPIQIDRNEDSPPRTDEDSIEIVFDDPPVVMPFLNGYLPTQPEHEVPSAQPPRLGRRSTSQSPVAAFAQGTSEQATERLNDVPLDELYDDGEAAAREEIPPVTSETAVTPDLALLPSHGEAVSDAAAENWARIEEARTTSRLPVVVESSDDDDDAFFMSSQPHPHTPPPHGPVLPSSAAAVSLAGTPPPLRELLTSSAPSQQLPVITSDHAPSNFQSPVATSRRAKVTVDANGKPMIVQPEMDFTVEPLDKWFEAEEARRAQQREAADERRKRAKLSNETLARLSRPKRQGHVSSGGKTAPIAGLDTPAPLDSFQIPSSTAFAGKVSHDANSAGLPNAPSVGWLLTHQISSPQPAARALSKSAERADAVNPNAMISRPQTTSDRPNETHCYLILSILGNRHRIAVSKKTLLSQVVLTLGLRDLAESGALAVWLKKPSQTAPLSTTSSPEQSLVTEFMKDSTNTSMGASALWLPWNSSPQSLGLSSGISNAAHIQLITDVELAEHTARIDAMALFASEWIHMVTFSEWVLRCSDSMSRHVFFDANDAFVDCC